MLHGRVTPTGSSIHGKMDDNDDGDGSGYNDDGHRAHVVRHDEVLAVQASYEMSRSPKMYTYSIAAANDSVFR